MSEDNERWDRLSQNEADVSSVPDSAPGADQWWYTRNEEHLDGSRPTRLEAIDAGIWEYGAEEFLIGKGRRFKYASPAFDIERIAEDFDDANHEYGPEDEGPSAKWSDEHCRELEDALGATMEAWLDRNGYRDAHAIDIGDYERIDAQAIETRRAETSGSVADESVIAESEAPVSVPLSNDQTPYSRGDGE